MMKHSDHTRADPSFINVTAEAVVEKGPPVPPLPRRGNATRRNTLLHVTLPLHQSCAGRREKAQLIRADKATQTPQLCSSVAEQDFNTAVVRGLCTACVAQRVERSAGALGEPNRRQINLQLGEGKTPHDAACRQLQLPVPEKCF